MPPVDLSLTNFGAVFNWLSRKAVSIMSEGRMALICWLNATSRSTKDVFPMLDGLPAMQVTRIEPDGATRTFARPFSESHSSAVDATPPPRLPDLIHSIESPKFDASARDGEFPVTTAATEPIVAL